VALSGVDGVDSVETEWTEVTDAIDGRCFSSAPRCPRAVPSGLAPTLAFSLGSVDTPSTSSNSPPSPPASEIVALSCRALGAALVTCEEPAAPAGEDIDLLETSPDAPSSGGVPYSEAESCAWASGSRARLLAGRSSSALSPSNMHPSMLLATPRSPSASSALRWRGLGGVVSSLSDCDDVGVWWGSRGDVAPP
jgi:hypothetical protein